MTNIKIRRYIPTTGSTVTLEDFDDEMIVIVAPAGNLAALTFAWPPNPQNSQKITFLFTKNIAAITHSGATLNSPLSSMVAGGSAQYIYDLGGVAYMSNGIQSAGSIVSLPFTASVAGGAGDCIFYPTDSGLVGGVALFSSIQTVQPLFDVADPNFAYAKPVVSNANKTVTTNCKKQTFNVVTLLSTNILGSATLGVAPNGTALSFLVHGVLA